jgi:hypothetical protein
MSHVEEPVDYFMSTKIIESFTKTVTVGETKQKLMFLTFQLKSGVDGVKSYSINTKNINSELLLSLLVSAKYGDNLTSDDLSKLHDLELKDLLPVIDANGNIEIEYSETGTVRLYRFIYDITSYDGKEGRPDYRTIWLDYPMIVFANLTNPELEKPKLTMDIDISDCDEILDELNTLINEVSTDLPTEDVDFLKNIINNCNCGGDKEEMEKCEMDDITLENFTLPSFEYESVLYEIANLDVLIYYLRQQVIKYKTETQVARNGSGQCYKFVGCLIKAYISVNKLYRKALNSYNTLLISAKHLKDRYKALADDHRRGIEAMKGIKSSTIEWIKSNLDSSFDISKITGSNRVELVNNVPYSFRDKYTSFYSSSTKTFINSGFEL